MHRDRRTAEPSAATERGSWVHRLALAAALSAIPLVLFGGSVTTLGAGMAVDGWLVAEGHFLLFFPVDAWLRDTGTFVEHTHRLFGVAVGLFALLACLASWLRLRRRSARILSLAALLAVAAQGVIGGFRVLDASSRLAFLHGALAQAVFALLWVAALSVSPRWERSEVSGSCAEDLACVRPRALAAVLGVYAQVVLGAWYRHAVRPSPRPGAPGILLVHIVGAVFVVLLVAALVRRLRELGASDAPTDPLRRHLARSGKRLAHLLGGQLLLGLLAWGSYQPDALGPIEWTLSILHVLVGGLLLAQCSVLYAWTLRGSLPARAPTHGLAAGPDPDLGGTA